MPSNKTVFCDKCNRDIEVRSDFAYLTLMRHISKEHK